MLRLLDDLPHRADLGDAPGIHDGDAVGGLGDDAHVVRHQHDGGAVIAAETLEQGDDLRLDRDVERRRRLVGDDEALDWRKSARAMTTRCRMPPENWWG